MADNVYAARPLPTDRGDGAESAVRPSTRASSDPGVFGALTITLLALIVWSLVSTWLLVSERGNLLRVAAGQQQQIEAANKVRSQLDAIATGMQRLADGGNASARQVVDELRRRGVTINVGAAAAK